MVAEHRSGFRRLKLKEGLFSKEEILVILKKSYMKLLY